MICEDGGIFSFKMTGLKEITTDADVNPVTKMKYLALSEVCFHV